MTHGLARTETLTRSQGLTRSEIGIVALAAFLIGGLGVGAGLAFAAHGPEMFLARAIAGLAGCF